MRSDGRAPRFCPFEIFPSDRERMRHISMESMSYLRRVNRLARWLCFVGCIAGLSMIVGVGLIRTHAQESFPLPAINPPGAKDFVNAESTNHRVNRATARGAGRADRRNRGRQAVCRHSEDGDGVEGGSGQIQKGPAISARGPQGGRNRATSAQGSNQLRQELNRSPCEG